MAKKKEEKAKHLGDWTVKEFEALPFREKWDKEEWFDTLVILPLKKLHESGYRLMDFVGVRSGAPICRLAGCSDVLGLLFTNSIERVSYRVGIDCLAKSGCFHLFAHGYAFEAGAALSSFVVTIRRKA